MEVNDATFYVGLDVGSTTAKIAVLDKDNRLVYHKYERHNAHVSELVGKYFTELKEVLRKPLNGSEGNSLASTSEAPSPRISLCVTGSVGMATAEQLKAEFVQEVVAASIYARNAHPEAKALIDIGGEDAKVVFFRGNQQNGTSDGKGKQNGSMELRMNGNCAGGTGAFIDQMSVLMGVDNQQMSQLAMKATHVYPMAARCGVFAKTDIQNLMARNLPEEDIAASIFHSIAVQTVVTLSHGIDFKTPILLCGGPLTFLPALRKAFCDYMKLSADDFIVSENSNLIPALGCAYRAKRNAETALADFSNNKKKILADFSNHEEKALADSESSPCSIDTLRARLNVESSSEWHSSLAPLFKSEEEHLKWLKSKEKFTTETKPLLKGKQKIVIGIDSGSTTTKIVAVRLHASTDSDKNIDLPNTPNDSAESARAETSSPTRDHDIVFTNYRLNLGNPIKAVADGLTALKEEAAHRGAELEVVGSCSTGYGEELIKAAFGLDSGIIETMAHERAAASLMPDVSFILDIGGQDMKAIFVENGAVVRMELNEACSSGCGTFIQTFANNMGYSVADFAKLACQSKAPCDLGTRCTVFMNSKVKQVLREGASVADISAGISYSVIKNCLYKVLKLHGNDNLGGKIVVQGGTMRNDSVVRAFELLTNMEVARSNMPELMGAYGCALHAIADYQRVSIHDSVKHRTWVARTIDDLLSLAHYDTKQLQCKGCENHCYVSRYTFAGGNKYYSGNKCERVFNNKGENDVKGENIYTYKYDLLFNRPQTSFTTDFTSKKAKDGDTETSENKAFKMLDVTKRYLKVKQNLDAVKRCIKVGIPRILNMYEEYPFWNALLRAAGFDITLSSESTFGKYEGALNTVMSDNICFPAKLAHSHLKELNENPEVDRILMPYVVYEHNDDPDRTLNSFNCPVVSGYSDVIKSVLDLQKPLDAPVINFANSQLLEKQIIDYLKSLGVSKKTAKAALRQAIAAQEEYCKHIKAKALEILYAGRKECGGESGGNENKRDVTERDSFSKTKNNSADKKPTSKLTILLAGRPYHTDPLVQHKLSEMIANLGVNVISDDIVRATADTAADESDPSHSMAETYLVKQWAYMNRIMKAAQWAAEQGNDVHFVQMTSFGCGPDSFIQDEIRDIMRRHGKPFTLLKIDDVSNIGSLKLRVRSLVESLKGAVGVKSEERRAMEVKSEERRVKNSTANAGDISEGSSSEKQENSSLFTLHSSLNSSSLNSSSLNSSSLLQTKVFKKEDVHRKILAPFMTEYLTPIIPPILKLIGYDVEVLPMSDEVSAELGLKFANNEICYPATLIVGDIIKTLKSGRYDLNNTAVVMSQTGGQCRATNYAGLIKRAMVANGFQDVPLLTLGVTASTGEASGSTDDKQDYNEQEGFNVPWLKYSQIIVTAILYGDAINEMYNACIVRERKKGIAKELRDKYMSLIDEPIARNSASGLVKLLEKAAEEFDQMTLDRDVPKVGIVGEIFLKFNPFSHQFLEQYIISKGIEVVPPLLAPFFLQEFVNVEVQKHMRLSCSRVPDFVVKGAYKGLIGRRLKQINKAASRFRYFRKFTNIYDDAKEVKGLVSLAAQFGEGWLLPADIVGYIRDGVDNIISLQPFGCIANHVISKGIEKRLHDRFPQLNLVSLDFDSGVSEVNVTNRLLLFLDSIAS